MNEVALQGKKDTDPATDCEPVSHTARTIFGIPYLYPWQRLAIANILDAFEAGTSRRPAAQHEQTENAGDSDLYDEDGILRGRQIVLLPTGAGKSLCFQIPSLLMNGPTLVIYPLLALMGDQMRSLGANGIVPALFRGGQSHEEREAQFALLEGKNGVAKTKLIIANPEVLAGREILERIARLGISHLAIDEAHCVSEWGDTFRPAYLDLKKIIRALDPPAVTAFTATASDDVLSRIAEVLFDGKAHLVRGETDRPNIGYSVYHCRAKNAALIRECAKRERPLVVFCATRGGTERCAALLRDAFQDTEIRFYHAGLQKDEKKEVEAWFHGHPGAILCTTCAWGMGVDKKDIRTVIHRDAPPTAEAYAQEAGRGGRDGAFSEAVLLWSPSDRKRLEKPGGLQKKRAQILIEFAESGKCRREVLLAGLGDNRAEKYAPEGESVLCSFCDICRGTACQYALDGDAVASYIRKNRRCFTRDEITDALYRAGNRKTGKLGYTGWNRSDFALILDELENEKWIKELEHWPWKGKMTIG